MSRFSRFMNAFRPYVWDPSLIIGQMVCMQAVFYASQSILLLAARIGGHSATVQTVFSPQVFEKLINGVAFEFLNKVS